VNTVSHLADLLRSDALALPSLAKFAIGLAIIVYVPRFSRRIRIPAVVGLLLSGIVVGPHGLDVIGANRPIADFFAELGKLLLMFSAGLEIDLALFRQARNRVIAFGILTTSLPLLLGTGVGFMFGYRPVAAVVLGSLLASHTLLAGPVMAKLGATRLEPITVTFGATVLSDTLSLVVFAVCVSTFQRGFSLPGLAVQLIEIAIFIPLILFGLSRLGAYFLRRVSDEEDAYFALMLLLMSVAAALAAVINLPGIVGAFLAGLAVNAAVHDQPAKEKLKFFGDSLFIPIFFVVTGFLIDPREFYRSIADNLGLASAVIFALLAGKWIAVQVAGRAFHYSPTARLTMWSLTLPQVAATLAATLVAFDTLDPSGQRLIDGRLLNVVLVLMLSTSILGPVLTEHFAPRMLPDLRPAKAA
jgi:Kef-type K+ transport system membrane component KefB